MGPVVQEVDAMPLVSIITPVYNAERWLAQTLASVRAQTLGDWEHLLVEDGSADDSAAIVEAAAREDGRIRLLRAPRNLGPSEARNLAIDAARGRFLAFLDADDLWLPEKLARSVEWMTKGGYGFIYHDYRHISPDGARVGELVRGPDELNLHTLHTRRGTGCLTVVIDRERIPEVRFPVCAKALNEDFRVWLRLVRDGYVGRRLACDLGRYRLSAGSRSANKPSSARETWKIYCDESGLSLPRALNWWMQYAWNSFWLSRHARPRWRSLQEPTWRPAAQAQIAPATDAARGAGMLSLALVTGDHHPVREAREPVAGIAAGPALSLRSGYAAPESNARTSAAHHE